MKTLLQSAPGPSPRCPYSVNQGQLFGNTELPNILLNEVEMGALIWLSLALQMEAYIF